MDKHLDSDQLCDYAENALDAIARATADAHLQGCAECRRELDVASAYFQAISDLEPVKAPANFLVKVRARIEKPSRWKALWAGLESPWRSVPAQLALLTILGITILTAYLHQNGGLNAPEYTQAPVPVSEAPVARLVAPDLSLNKQEMSKDKLNRSSDLRQEDDKVSVLSKRMTSGEVGGSAGSARGAAMPDPAPAPKASEASKTMLADQAPNEPTVALGNTGNIQEPSMNEETEALEEAPEKFLQGLAKTGESRLGGRRGKETKADEDRFAAKAESRDAEKNEVTVRASKKSAPAAPPALASSPSPASTPPEPSVIAERPRLFLHARMAKDTSTILSGLKAMGAEVLSEIRGEDLQLILRITPPMLSDIKAYLQRYGRFELLGNLSELPNAPVRITLRIDWPVTATSPK